MGETRDDASIAMGRTRMNLLADKRALAVVAAVGLLASVLVWALSRGEGLGEMRVRAEGGTVEIERDGELIRVGDQTAVESGDILTTAKGAYATLRLERDRLIHLGPQASVEILGGSALASQNGTLVAEARDPLRVAMGDTVARGRDTDFRVDRELGTTRAAVYDGRLDLTAPGSPVLQLTALWQTTVTADRLYGQEPYELREDDHFDKEFLDSLVELDQELANLKQGFAPLVSGSAPDLAFFASLADQKVDFLRRYMNNVSGKRPGYTVDLMIGLKLADVAKGSLDETFRRGFGYYRQGATWGVAGGLLGLDRDEDWKPAVNQLQVAMLGSSGVAGGGGDDTDFTLAGGEDTTSAGDPVDGSAPSGGDGDTGGGDAPPPPDDGGGDDDNDDDGGGDDETEPPPPPPPCDVQCEVEKVIPTPDPNDALDPPPLGN